MTKREMIMAAIKEMGYNSEIDNDGDVVFFYQMKQIFALIGDENENYLMLLLPKVAEVDEGEEPVILTTCNKITRELKLCKVYVDESFKLVNAVCEFYYADQETLKQFITNSVESLGSVRTLFRKTKADLAALETD